ncbi:hypothetical protein N7486_005126 [Penicillium sp. IBT 16267x]|nr:hypothetical protein N7486_005126 [Penicillium sp. IBT 16267x]
MSRRDSVVDLTPQPQQVRRFSGQFNSQHVPSSLNRHSISHESPPNSARGVKRRRIETDLYSSDEDSSEDGQIIESVDLTSPETPALATALAKQRQDAIQAQQPQDEDKSMGLLKAYKCPICMDTPENATSTICGHLFCHSCIIECLDRADEHNRQMRTTCPVCRKHITKKEISGPRRNLIPLQFKLMTKKRTSVQLAEA